MVPSKHIVRSTSEFTRNRNMLVMSVEASIIFSQIIPQPFHFSHTPFYCKKKDRLDTLFYPTENMQSFYNYTLRFFNTYTTVISESWYLDFILVSYIARGNMVTLTKSADVETFICDATVSLVFMFLHIRFEHFPPKYL